MVGVDNSSLNTDSRAHSPTWLAWSEGWLSVLLCKHKFGEHDDSTIHIVVMIMMITTISIILLCCYYYK